MSLSLGECWVDSYAMHKTPAAVSEDALVNKQVSSPRKSSFYGHQSQYA